MEVIKLIDAHINLAATMNLSIDYIAMSQATSDKLTQEIISFAGIDTSNVKISGIKQYKDVDIKIHDVSAIKVVYEAYS